MTGFGTNQILARRLRIGFANSALFRERFLHHHCPRADYLSLNIGGFLPGRGERKESNSTMEPRINHLPETEPALEQCVIFGL